MKPVDEDEATAGVEGECGAPIVGVSGAFAMAVWQKRNEPQGKGGG